MTYNALTNKRRRQSLATCIFNQTLLGAEPGHNRAVSLAMGFFVALL